MPGPTIVAIFSFGVHPTGMKNAVIKPQAMIAPMFGMTMLDKNVPTLCAWTRAPVPLEVVVVVAIWFLSVKRHVTTVTVRTRGFCNTFGHVAKYSGTFFCPFIWFLSRTRLASRGNQSSKGPRHR